VLKASTAAVAGSGDLLGLDLRRTELHRLDPRRIEAAVADGRAAGFATGRAEALAEARAEAEREREHLLAEGRADLERLLATTEQAVADATARLAAMDGALADRASEVAFALAEAIVGRELQLASDPGRDAVRRALAHVPDDLEVTVHLNPDDATAIAGGLPAGRSVTVVPDPAMTRGDCIAVAGSTTVDARIATALDRARAVLLDGQP
jgi:flagellar assembly protein FliH